MGAPFDKATAVAYGNLVCTAYTMFDEPIGDPLQPQPPVDFPAAYELTAWIQMSDFALFGEKFVTFYGFIAHERANPLVHALVIRGTGGFKEWWDDALCIAVPFSAEPSAGLVHDGFNRIYQTMRVIPYSARATANTKSRCVRNKPSQSFGAQVEAHIRGVAVAHGDAQSQHTLVVTGHSLGAALGTLFVMEHALAEVRGTGIDIKIDTLCTFASPRVGTAAFVSKFDALPLTSWRIVNAPDVVPKVPFVWMGYRHVALEYEFDSSGIARSNLSCWHSIQTYLHVLDPAQRLDAQCSLRMMADAKRRGEPESKRR